jgi:hypothetical protein
VDRTGELAVRALRVAAVLTILALALMVWSIVVPTPLPVMLAMTVGQVLGTSAFAIYAWVVIRDLRRAAAARRAANLAPPVAAGEPIGASESSE